MAHKTFFKHQQPSRVERKRQIKADEAKAEREVFRAVDARDGHRCRVCRRRCDPNAVDLLNKAHRHHIVYRSKQGACSSENLVTLCADCHSEIHKHVLDVRGNADTGIEVWRLNSDGWYLDTREWSVFAVERD